MVTPSGLFLDGSWPRRYTWLAVKVLDDASPVMADLAAEQPQHCRQLGAKDRKTRGMRVRRCWPGWGPAWQPRFRQLRGQRGRCSPQSRRSAVLCRRRLAATGTRPRSAGPCWSTPSSLEHHRPEHRRAHGCSGGGTGGHLGAWRGGGRGRWSRTWRRQGRGSRGCIASCLPAGNHKRQQQAEPGGGRFNRQTLLASESSTQAVTSTV